MVAGITHSIIDSALSNSSTCPIMCSHWL